MLALVVLVRRLETKNRDNNCRLLSFALVTKAAATEGGTGCSRGFVINARVRYQSISVKKTLLTRVKRYPRLHPEPHTVFYAAYVKGCRAWSCRTGNHLSKLKFKGGGGGVGPVGTPKQTQRLSSAVRPMATDYVQSPQTAERA